MIAKIVITKEGVREHDVSELLWRNRTSMYMYLGICIKSWVMRFSWEQAFKRRSYNSYDPFDCEFCEKEIEKW